MRMVALAIIVMIAALHAYIAWFEIFAWEAKGPRVFSSFAPKLFAQTVTMAANQGLYNAFLAAGLLWSLLIRDRIWQRNVATCFLLFVAMAGFFGAATITLRILYIQAIPAVLGLTALYLSSRGWSEARKRDEPAG